MSWQSLDNDLSVDINTLKTIPDTDYICSIKRLKNLDDRINLYPYKLVTLEWLISIGKCISRGKLTADALHIWSGKTLFAYSTLFTGDEPYLPLGDIMTTNSIANGIITYITTNEVPVLLIANKQEYCKLYSTIPVTAYSNDGFVPRVSNGGPNVNFFGHAFSESGTKLASPNSDYIIDMSSTIFINVGSICRNLVTVGACIDPTPVGYSSPYFTFGTQYNMFKDIITSRMKSYCCVNSLPPTFSSISSLICKSTQPSSNECSTFMNNFCEGDNLLLDQCFKYCAENNCNLSLNKYCQGNKADKTSPNYNRTCSCFNTTQFYQDWRNKVFSFLPQDKAELIIKNMPPVKPMCDYPDCSTGQSIMPFKSDIGQCPPSSVQICLNNSDISASGKMTDSKIDARSFINCAQQYGILPETSPTGGGGGASPTGGGGGGGSSGGGGGASPTGGGDSGGGASTGGGSENNTVKTSSQNNKTAIIAVASVVIIIALAIIVYMLYV